MFRFWDCSIFSRFSSFAAVSSPLHSSSSPGICSHVAGRPEGKCAGLWDGGGVHQHRFRNRTWTSECGPEGSTPPGTQGTSKTVQNPSTIFTVFLSRWGMDTSIPAIPKTSEHLGYKKLSYCLTDVKGASDKEVQCFLAEKSYLRLSFSSAEPCESAHGE